MATLLEKKLQEQKKFEEEEEFDDDLIPIDAITLVSNDGYEFVVDKKTALISQTIRNILYGGGNFQEAQTKVIYLPKIRAIILERIIEYWHYKTQYSDHLDLIPPFDVDPKMAVELLQAADYLQT
ncbi:elongin-C-like isoform X1 [Histomonas meleagridis]|uniref:elongin-C-like isoform X1 n=1 Tax=Histomonas meleagridis TaxID=135588 RepID=UPI00355A4B99|nr:elongin-C-like isoform X1 [Histomonas meleagridis]KAH0802231.1 elongin-C-like isoform X1 [Histomonas meleagridis]